MDPEKFDPSAVNDVETAKLALRWALERIHLLQDEAAKAKDAAQGAQEQARLLTDQLAKKEEAVQRWSSTIKVWEENWKTQGTMEAEARERVKKELVVEEDAVRVEERRRFDKEIDALRSQLAQRETHIGQLR